MARTNKRGIAAKKAHAQKQAKRMKGGKRFDYPKRKLGLEDAVTMGIIVAKENPAGNTYHWFFNGRKVCWETRMRVDPDGYRMIRTNKGGAQMVDVPVSGWVRKQLIRKMRAH